MNGSQKMVILKEKKNAAQNKCKQTTDIGCVYEERLVRIKVPKKDKIITISNFY